jgi:predicted transposase YdaD
LSAGEREALRLELKKEGDPMLDVTELTWADKVYLEGLEKGLEQGREEGRQQGREQGREEGLSRGREEARGILRRLLAQRFGTVPAALGNRIAAADGDALAALLDQALAATSVDDLIAG